MAKDDNKLDGRTGAGSYDAQDITVLEGLQAVRKRPGMYIGSTGVRGLHHLVYEVVDNSVDEALAGHCSAVDVTIHPDNSVTVADDGRGIPVGTMEKEGRSALEVVLTVLHAGGKFGDGGGYKVSGGLHGVGVSVVNALSELLQIEVRREGHVWRQTYERGAPQAPLARGEASSETGTTITFRPDAEIFETTDLDFSVLEQRLRETAFLTRGLRITIDDERGEKASATFKYDGGIEDFVRYLNANKESIGKKVVFFEGDSDEGAVEVAMQWNTTYQESVFSFANNINTHEGGSHLSGFRSALTTVLNRYARARGLLKEKDDNLTGEDVREGLTAVISAKLHRPAVRGPDEDEARQPRHGGVRALDRLRPPDRVPRGEPDRGQRDHPQGRPGRAGARGGAQGARPHAAQVGAGELDAAGQARRLLGEGPVARRAVHRRGRLRRRLGQAGPRPQHAGRAAAARQDPQRREEPHRQGPQERRDPGADHGDRHRRARRVRPHEGALPQAHPDDRRRCRRRPHPHARADAAVPRDAGADRGRLRLHRQAAALQAQAGLQRALRREGLRARADPALGQAREGARLRPPRHPVQAHRGALAALLAPAQAVRGLVLDAARRVRLGRRHVPRGVGRARRADQHRRGRARADRALADRQRALRDLARTPGRRRRSPSARSRRRPASRACS